MDELSDKEVSELLYRVLKTFPIGSDEHTKCLETLQLISPYSGKKFVMYVPSWRCIDLSGESSYEEVESILFKHRRRVSDIDGVGFKLRKELEYNLSCRQVCVAAKITIQNENMEDELLLETFGKGRVCNSYTLVQGHVDFSPDVYRFPMSVFLRKNMLREIQEELILPPDAEIRICNYPQTVLCMDTTTVQSEHIGFVFHVGIKCGSEWKVISKEPDKHKIVYLSEIEDNMEKMDPWSSIIYAKKFGGR